MSTMKFFKAEEVIAAEGEHAKNLFILVDGKIGVFKNNQKIIEFSKPGEIVGEMSLILNKPRSATIKALTDTNLLVVTGELDDIIKIYPDISKKLIKSLAERLAKVTSEHWN